MCANKHRQSMKEAEKTNRKRMAEKHSGHHKTANEWKTVQH